MEVNIRPRLSHSNSFGNDAEKDTAGCRALDRKYIVIGGDSMKRQFCLPCFLEIKKAGKHDIERVRGGVNMKITCWRCKRRRFGAEYEISRKGGVSRDNG